MLTLRSAVPNQTTIVSRRADLRITHPPTMMQPTFAELPPPEETASTAAATASTEPSATESSQSEPDHTVANLSSPWEYDDAQQYCAGCAGEFTPLNRKHHCRFCGKIFCGDCSSQRKLIPPSSIVLVPRGGKKAKATSSPSSYSFSPDQDPDRMLTYVGQEEQLLYGKGLEERFQLAREPLRVCGSCSSQLDPLQMELRKTNSNAMRYNHIDPNDAKRMFNSPLAFTLGHEVRKAAYTLNNLLPMPRRMGALAAPAGEDTFSTIPADLKQQCKDTCGTPGELGDGVKIPALLLKEAKGIAVLTIAKAGFGLVGGEFGTGLVVARLTSGQWSAPSAIGAAGISWGALIGAQVSDHVFLLMTDAAVEMLFSNNGSVNLGADIGVALGPLGRALEGNVGASIGSFAPIYTYSLSKGLYAGASLDGKVIGTRHDVNEKFYGLKLSASELLSGAIPTPPAAQPLYDALTRCHVYATSSSSSKPARATVNTNNSLEYGEYYNTGHVSAVSGSAIQPMMPPADNDQHSYSHVSDT